MILRFTDADRTLFMRLAWIMLPCVPILFMLLKVLDRRLEYPPSESPDHGVSWYWREGIFGKLDDISFWVLVAGLLAIVYISRAAMLLGKHIPDRVSQLEVSGRTLCWWLLMLLVAAGMYVLIMYPTKGTFFKGLPKQKMIAQVLEGLFNITMIGIAYAYFFLGNAAINTLDRYLKISNHTVQQHTSKDGNNPITEVATLLVNTFWAVLLGGLLSIPVLTTLAYFGITLASLNDVLGGISGAILITVLFFSPFGSFHYRLWKLLTGQVRWKRNFTLSPAFPFWPSLREPKLFIWIVEPIP